MHVLVTGATGAVGSRLCEELLLRKIDVTGIARSAKTGEHGDDATSRPKEFELIYCDLAVEGDLTRVFEKLRPIDCIFHVAGQTYRSDSPGMHPYFRDNFVTTLNLLECARVFKVNKFILSSSYQVYGLDASQAESASLLMVDESHMLRPYDFYDASKYHAEHICKFYHERFGIECFILRYSKIFGPGLKGGFIYTVAHKALSNAPIEIVGDIGTDHVYIDDVVSANLAALNKKSLGFEIYNIGSGQQWTFYDLCSMIVRLAGSSSEVKYRDTPRARFSLDISKAKQHLNYRPMVIEDGLRKYIDYIRTRNN